jgi:hypothetical protein
MSSVMRRLIPTPSLLLDGISPSAAAGSNTTYRNRPQRVILKNAGLLVCIDSLAALAAMAVVFISINVSKLPIDAQGFPVCARHR